jgi:hypothetical protein
MRMRRRNRSIWKLKRGIRRREEEKRNVGGNRVEERD